jgi:hypothetical protein
MARRLSAFALAAGLVAAQFGCHSRCDSRPGLFTSRGGGCAPCQTVGRNTGCFDGATGQPCPCPPEMPGALVPGGPYPPPGVGPVPGGAIPRPDELHMPAPSDLIRPPAVPIPAPPPGDARLPFPATPGTPVRGGPNK